MTRLLSASAALLWFAAAGAGVRLPAIIPQPASVELTDGAFVIPDPGLTLANRPGETAPQTIAALAETLGDNMVGLAQGAGAGNIHFTTDTALNSEGYILTVDPRGITVKSGGDAGAFYAVTTLGQLLRDREGNALQSLTISDEPRFGYRGVMIDVTRCFVPFDELKRIVDMAAGLKLNNLHLHLTDDNGWRLEIMKYPRLTQVGAWRVDRPEIFPARQNQREGEPATYGGFYTQDQMRELVDYASRRHVNIVPEIEMPAHAVAALAAYPSLTCPVQTEFFGVLPGIGGSAASIIACAGNDSTYQFFKDVIDEVTDIFPSPYIHIGGDEAEKSHWQACPRCNERMKQLGFTDFEQLQGYFMDTVNAHLRSRGRTAIGWDEVTYGEPREDIVVMGWQGDGHIAVDYSRLTGRKFIMTPASKLYLIRYQGPQQFEPFTYFGNNTLADVYGYEAVAPDWSEALEANLLGIQGSLWTEFCHTPADVEYLLMPRMIALADNAWRPKGSADWPEFLEALDRYLPSLEADSVNYARSMYNLDHLATPDGKGGVDLRITCIRPDVEIRLAADSASLATATAAPAAIHLADVETVVSAAAFRDGHQLGRVLTLAYSPHLASGRPATSTVEHPALHVLTDGLRGSDRNNDGHWAQFDDDVADITVDLGETRHITSVSLGTLANINLCLAAPRMIELYVSDNGSDFTPSATIETSPATQRPATTEITDLKFNNLDLRGRYVRLKAYNSGKVPAGYPREHRPTIQVFDEIIIK